MIRFDTVTVEYDGRPIIRDISFRIRKGDTAVIHGKSGSGKTTILTTIVGMHVPSAGTVFFDGRAVESTSISDVRRSIAFIGQEPVLGAQRIREALLLPFTYRANRNNTPGARAIGDILYKLQLDPDILDRETAVVSGGEKQRIAIARALLLDKKVFLLDEVTSALDAESKEAVIRLFREGGYTIFSVSHDPDWFELCSTFIRVEEGTVADVSDSPGTPE